MVTDNDDTVEAQEADLREITADTHSIFMLIAVAPIPRTRLRFYMVRYTPAAQADMRGLLRAHLAVRSVAKVERMTGGARLCPAWSGTVDLRGAYHAIRHVGDGMGGYDGPYHHDPFAGVLDDAAQVSPYESTERMTFILRGKEAAQLIRDAQPSKRMCVVTPNTWHAAKHALDPGTEDDTDDASAEPHEPDTIIDALGARLDIQDHHVPLEAATSGDLGTQPPVTTFVVGGDYPAFLADLLTRPSIFQEVASPTDPAVAEVKRTVLHAADTGDDVYNYIDPRECVAFGSAYSTQQEVDVGGTREDPESLTVVYPDVYASLLRINNRATTCGGVRWVTINANE